VRRGCGLAIKHAGAVEELTGVLALVQEETIGATDNLDAEEVVQGTQVLEGGLSAKAVGESAKKIRGAGHQDDVVDVEEQVRGVGALVEDKQRSIRVCRAEAEVVEKRCDALVPHARGLLEFV
jgi:hypothetical protein